MLDKWPSNPRLVPFHIRILTYVILLYNRIMLM
jgi:hypothetical protein